jgi:hypothetical protein
MGIVYNLAMGLQDRDVSAVDGWRNVSAVSRCVEAGVHHRHSHGSCPMDAQV